MFIILILITIITVFLYCYKKRTYKPVSTSIVKKKEYIPIIAGDKVIPLVIFKYILEIENFYYLKFVCRGLYYSNLEFRPDPEFVYIGNRQFYIGFNPCGTRISYYNEVDICTNYPFGSPHLKKFVENLPTDIEYVLTRHTRRLCGLITKIIYFRYYKHNGGYYVDSKIKYLNGKFVN